MNDSLYFQLIKPDKSIEDFVVSFWCLKNVSDSKKDIVVLPDGSIDLIFTKSETEHFQPTLLGIGTLADYAQLTGNTKIFAISFKLLAAEYVFQNPIAQLLNHAENLSANFWDFNETDFSNLELFSKKASVKIQSLLPESIDERKLKLCSLIYESNGEISVKELAEKSYWSRQQINRYFNQQFGLSVKAYCNILRFRASFQHIKEGKLFPENNFADQSHFIKEVKKLSGVSPKELSKNSNERFIQFTTLNSK